MKSIYRFCVVETVKKYVEFEADNLDEANEIVLKVSVNENPDSCEREANLLGVESLENINGLPKYVNGWNLEYAENMTYWKQKDDHTVAVCLYWLDTVEGDEGYNPEHDSWVILKGMGETVDAALEDLDFMPFPISDVMPRKDAEYTMLEWFKSQEG